MSETRFPTACLLIVLAAPAAAQQVVRLPARDMVLTGEPIVVYRVGAADGRSWETFGRIVDVAFDDSDNAYVLDAQSRRIVVFDARGAFVREFGARGNGPGELGRPAAIEILRDGSLALLDLSDRGINLYRTTGEFVRLVALNDDAFNRPADIRADPRGGLFARTHPRPVLRARSDEPEPRRSILYRFPLDGAPPLDVHEYPLPQAIVGRNDPLDRTRYTVLLDATPIFSATPSWDVLPDGGMVVHYEDAYVIRVLDTNGRHVRTITRPFEPRRVTEADRNAELERQRTGGPNAAAATATISGTTSGMRIGTGQPLPFRIPALPFADVMSVVTRIATDPLGHIRVQRRNADGTPRGPIDLIDAAGRYIGTLPAGQHLPMAVSASGLAAYVEFDELDVPYLVVRRLPVAWR